MSSSSDSDKENRPNQVKKKYFANRKSDEDESDEYEDDEEFDRYDICLLVFKTAFAFKVFLLILQTKIFKTA